MVDMKRIEREIEQDRRETRLRKKKDEELWSKISNYPPIYVPGNWRIYLAKRSNGPCIYQYTGIKTTGYLFWKKKLPNKIVDKLQFSNEPGRNYYRVGDKIMGGEQEESKLYDLFHELPRPSDKDATWTDLLWWFLNEGETEKYKFCWIIKSIEPNGRGGGNIFMTGLIYFEGYNVELTTKHKWTREQLNQNFIDTSIDFTVIQLMAKAVATVSLVALQGVSKAATAPAKKLAKKIIKKQLKKRASRQFRIFIFKAVKSHLVKTAALSTKEFFVVFIKELKKGYSEKDFYEKISGRKASWKTIEPALREAMVAFIGKVIDGLFSATIGEAIKNNKEIRKIQGEIATIYLSVIMTTPFNSVAKAFSTAYSESQRNKKSMWLYFEEELKKNLNDSLKQAFLKDVTGVIVSN
jgi:hypothetical protein